MEPADNVELRADRHGHLHVVFAFPYRADIVDAVRAIPGRRFDWDAKEWWAPQADDTAPFVKGVIERHPSLRVADDVRAWLADAAAGWVGRVSATRLEGRGAFALETISGDVPEELGAEERGGRHWVPFSQAAADLLLELRGARLDKRALRCATKLQVGLEPAGASLALVESVGEPRFTLDVNWDPETIPAFLALPACEAHGRSLPLDPYLVEPLEHYLRTYAVDVGPERGGRAGAPAGRARRRDRGRPPLARARRARRSRSRRSWAASSSRSSAPGSPTRSTPAGRSSPTSRGWARPSRRSPRWRPTTPTRRS